MGTDAISPANGMPTAVDRSSRIPMNLPQQKLQVPAIPGYYCYWFRGEPQRIAQALRAGYTFVEQDEVPLYNHDLAGDKTVSGNSDMGSRVSALAGGLDEGTMQAARLYLMKLPEEWHQDDVAGQLAQTQKLIDSLNSGLTGGDKNPHVKDDDITYVKQSNLFQPKPIRR